MQSPYSLHKGQVGDVKRAPAGRFGLVLKEKNVIYITFFS